MEWHCLHVANPDKNVVSTDGIRANLTRWAPSQYPKIRLFVRSRKVSKPRDWYFKLSYRFEIWQAHRQHCCRRACQISEQSDNSKYKSRGFETLRDLTERRLFGYWDGALTPFAPPAELPPWHQIYFIFLFPIYLYRVKHSATGCSPMLPCVHT